MASEEKRKQWKTPPQEYLKEPVYQIVTYTKGEIKKTANLIVSVRIVDIEKGEIIAAKTLESQKIVKDEYNEGVEFAGIVSNPERIDSDKTLLNKLQKQMIDNITQFILEPFKAREQDLVQKVDLMLERREYNKAMEDLVNSMIISEIKNKTISKEVYKKEDNIFKEMLR
jgi:nitrogenase subunit NifH